MARTIVFDVNETLLDLTALDPLFERAFGRSGLRREWFAQLLQSAFVSIITDSYADFGTIGRAALHMVAQRNGIRKNWSLGPGLPFTNPEPGGNALASSV